MADIFLHRMFGVRRLPAPANTSALVVSGGNHPMLITSAHHCLWQPPNLDTGQGVWSAWNTGQSVSGNGSSSIPPTSSVGRQSTLCRAPELVRGQACSPGLQQRLLVHAPNTSTSALIQPTLLVHDCWPTALGACHHAHCRRYTRLNLAFDIANIIDQFYLDIRYDIWFINNKNNKQSMGLYKSPFKLYYGIFIILMNIY